jgi:hypothetical protein
MRVALICALAGCGGAGAVVAPGNAGELARCDPDEILRSIEVAGTRAQLGRLGALRLTEHGRAVLDGDGREVDEVVPVLAERDRLEIAIAGDGVTIVGWIDRRDLAPVTLMEHRVVRAPGGRARAERLGVTVLPGHPTTTEVRGGWVRVRGHRGLAFDGWIPDDTAKTWEAVPGPDVEDARVELPTGTRLVEDPGGGGEVLAVLTRPATARLVESIALGADKVEVITGDARAIGYAARPELTRVDRPLMDFTDIAIEGERGHTQPVHACLHDGPGGAVVGVVSGPLVTIAASGVRGWAETPIATPWGDVVAALPAPAWLD